MGRELKRLHAQAGGFLCQNKSQAAGHSDHSSFDGLYLAQLLIFVQYYGNKISLELKRTDLDCFHFACNEHADSINKVNNTYFMGYTVLRTSFL